MISTESFSQAVQYKFTGGGTFGWDCFDQDARYLDSEGESYSASIIFGGPEYTVYFAEAHDYTNKRSYRWINPNYEEIYNNAAIERNINNKQAWDDVEYTEIEDADDFLEKCAAIVAGDDYDNRVKVPLNLPNDQLLKLTLMAHQRDITLNQLVEEILLESIQQDKTNLTI